MTRIHLRLVVAALLAAAGLRWIIDSNAWSGPVLMSVDADHGVHLNDWLTFALWAASWWVAAPTWSPVGRRVLLPLRRGR